MNENERWENNDLDYIFWDVKHDPNLPHADHLEMSGRQVSTIMKYSITEELELKLSREIIWPMLRTKPNDVRGYLRRTFGPEIAPRFTVNGEPIIPGFVILVEYTNVLNFTENSDSRFNITRHLFPSTHHPVVIEEYRINDYHGYGERARTYTIAAEPFIYRETAKGVYGEYVIEVIGKRLEPTTLGLADPFAYELIFRAYIQGEEPPVIEPEIEYQLRARNVSKWFRDLRLHTPDDALNTAFSFAKLRAAESVFATKMGLVHSPGGGRYYGGVWANDQCEYSGPFFPFLGDAAANEAALNAYRIFARDMGPDYAPIWSSHEVEGDVPCCGKDRGDAAMYAYGAARFALASGDEAIARELWPHIGWCLEYCRRQVNAFGVVKSESDELEGRFPTGDANLSTSALTYGALRSAADLALALGKRREATEYAQRADALEIAIEIHFGGDVEGYETYRYYDGNTTLRAWICLPLAMGILTRKAGTIAALFSPQLWTADGLATESGDTVFWDRATLYALRGVFIAGETETALEYLTAYTRRRLLGDHVPYPIEAYPEGDGAHLSAESALYCRIITEGLFGITPTGLRSFRCVPRLPAQWPEMRLTNLRAFGSSFDLRVGREIEDIRLIVSVNGQPIFDKSQADGGAFDVTLPIA